MVPSISDIIEAWEKSPGATPADLRAVITLWLARANAEAGSTKRYFEVDLAEFEGENDSDGGTTVGGLCHDFNRDSCNVGHSARNHEAKVNAARMAGKAPDPLNVTYAGVNRRRAQFLDRLSKWLYSEYKKSRS